MILHLTKIRSDREQDRFSQSDDPDENGPVTQHVRVNAYSIRCYYPRKENRVGTRLTFSDGGGFAVTERAETIDAMIEAAGIRLIAPPAAPEEPATEAGGTGFAA